MHLDACVRPGSGVRGRAKENFCEHLTGQVHPDQGLGLFVDHTTRLGQSSSAGSTRPIQCRNISNDVLCPVCDKRETT